MNPNATLWSLCLTNRYLNYVSEPVLYQEFHHTFLEYPALVHFLRAIIRRPHLASHVKRISLDYTYLFKTFEYSWHLPPPSPKSPPGYPLGDDDLRLFIRTARESLLVSKADETRIWRLEDPALVLLLFSQASNLRELHYNVSGNQLKQDSTHLINTALWDMLVSDGRLLRPFPFSSLRKVTLSSFNTVKEWDGAKRRFALNSTAAWLFLPSVESLDLSGCIMDKFCPYAISISSSDQPYERPRIHERLPPELSVVSLTSITFRDSVVHMDALYDMLSHCKSLKSFDFQWDGPEIGPGDYDYGKVGRALRTQKHSLETLRFDATKVIYEYDPVILKHCMVDSFESLKFFEKLSYVDVPGLATIKLEILLGLDEILPPNIQTLKIQSIGYNDLYQIEELARVAPERFRSLLLVEIGVWELKLVDYLITNCVEFFAERGVTLVVKKHTCKSTYIRSRRACEQVRKHSVSFWPNGDVGAGNVTIPQQAH
ncbi:hypothetical protein V2W45_1465548 [Cenococcum geophilum]